MYLPVEPIALIELSQQTYVLEPQFQQQIDQDESLWWSDLMEVVLKATPEIAINFKQRAILPEQRNPQGVRRWQPVAGIAYLRLRATAPSHQVLDALPANHLT